MAKRMMLHGLVALAALVAWEGKGVLMNVESLQGATILPAVDGEAPLVTETALFALG